MNILLVNRCVLFLLLSCLLISLQFGNPTKTIKEYNLQNRTFGIGVLVITLLTTFMGISHLEAIRLASVEGIISFVILLFSLSIPLVFSLFIFLNLVYFKNCYTLSDVMGVLYGAKARSLSALISMVFCLLVIISELVATGVLGRLLNLSPQVTIFLVGTFITLYSYLKGVRPFTLINVLPFILIIIAMGLLVEYVLSNEFVGGVTTLYTKLKEHRENSSSKLAYHLAVWDHPKLESVLLANCFWVICPTLFLTPPVIQRALSINDKRQLNYTFLGLTVFYIVFRLIALIIGLSVVVSGIGIQEKHIETRFFTNIIAYFFRDSYGQCLLLLATFGLVIATAIAYLNALVVLIVHDIIKPIYKYHNQALVEEFHVISKTAVLCCSFCTLVALYIGEVSSSSILCYSMAFFSVICIPFIVGVIGLKVSFYSFLYSLSAFFALFIGIFCFRTYYQTNAFIHSSTMKSVYIAWFPSLLLSGIVFMIVNYIKCGGFLFVNREEVKQYEQMGKEQIGWSLLFVAPVEWANLQVKKNGCYSTFLGLLLAITYMLPNLNFFIKPRYGVRFIMSLRFIGILLSTGLLLRKNWPVAWRKYFSLYWYIVIFYCIPFYSLVFLLDAPEAKSRQIQVWIFLIWLLLLVDWRTFLLFYGVAFVGAIAVDRFICGVYIWETYMRDVKSLWSFWLAIVGVLVVVITFSRKNEWAITSKMKCNTLLSHAFGHDLRNSLNRIPSDFVSDFVQKHARSEQSSKSGEKGVFMTQKSYKKWLRLSHDIRTETEVCRKETHMFENLIASSYFTKEHIAEHSIHEVLKEACWKVNRSSRDKVVLLSNSTDFKVRLYPDLFYHVITNMVKNSFWHGEASKVAIWTEKKTRTLYIADNGKGIPIDAQPRIFELFYTTNGRGIGLAFAKMIVESMGATIGLTRSNKQGTTFYVSFPTTTT